MERSQSCSVKGRKVEPKAKTIPTDFMGNSESQVPSFHSSVFFSIAFSKLSTAGTRHGAGETGRCEYDWWSTFHRDTIIARRLLASRSARWRLSIQCVLKYAGNTVKMNSGCKHGETISYKQTLGVILFSGYKFLSFYNNLSHAWMQHRYILIYSFLAAIQ